MTRTLSKDKRSSSATLLVEVGTEELPPRAIARLGEAFATAWPSASRSTLLSMMPCLFGTQPPVVLR